MPACPAQTTQTSPSGQLRASERHSKLRLSTSGDALTLTAGRTLTHYRLAELIGEGGMVVVWKAMDTILGPEVAIKVLPHDFSQDPDRMARFDVAATILASLN